MLFTFCNVGMAKANRCRLAVRSLARRMSGSITSEVN